MIYRSSEVASSLAKGIYTQKAHNEVKRLANKVVSLLPKGKVIAVHNNQEYSLKDYLPGHDLENDALNLYVDDKQYYRNFFLVTKRKDFFRLKALKFNCILQQENATDDGSLSIYLSSESYINIEAGYDQLEVQIKMLKDA